MNTELYPGIAFSPQTELADNIGAGDTIIPVLDVSGFPPAPCYATIGTDEEGETIRYAAKTAGALSGCKRGIEGTAKAWSAGEPIGRNFTAKDHADLIAAVQEAEQTAQADGVTFSDGRTFQEKYDAGELTGPSGPKGDPGQDGATGAPGPKASEITVVLQAGAWSGRAQTVQSPLLLASGYGYIPAPNGSSYGMYAACVVRADDVETDGEMTFRCEEVPTADLTVNLMRIEVE